MAKANANAGAKDQLQVEYHHARYPAQVAKRYEVLRSVGGPTHVHFFTVRGESGKHLGTIVVVTQRKLAVDAASLKKLETAIQKEVSKGTGIFTALKKAKISLANSTEKENAPAGVKARKKKTGSKKKAGSSATKKKADTTKKKADATKKKADATKKKAGKKKKARSDSAAKPVTKKKTTTTKKKASKKKKARREDKARRDDKARMDTRKTRADNGERRKKKKRKSGESRSDGSRNTPKPKNSDLPPPGMPSDEAFWADDNYDHESRSVGVTAGTYPQNMLPAPAPTNPAYAPVVGGPSSTRVEEDWNRFLAEVRAADAAQRGRSTSGHHEMDTVGTVGNVQHNEAEPYEDLMGVFYPD